jgi:hypothetical protein
LEKETTFAILFSSVLLNVDPVFATACTRPRFLLHFRAFFQFCALLLRFCRLLLRSMRAFACCLRTFASFCCALCAHLHVACTLLRAFVALYARICMLLARYLARFMRFCTPSHRTPTPYISAVLGTPVRKIWIFTAFCALYRFLQAFVALYARIGMLLAHFCEPLALYARFLYVACTLL